MILGPELQIPVLPAAPGRELPAEGALAGEGEAGLGAGQRRLSGRRPLVPGEAAADPSFSIVWRISRVLSSCPYGPSSRRSPHAVWVAAPEGASSKLLSFDGSVSFSSPSSVFPFFLSSL